MSTDKKPTPERVFSIRLNPERQARMDRVAVTGIPHAEIIDRMYAAYIAGKIKVPGLPALKQFEQ